MASPTALLTKLDAVNMCLSSIGQSPINTLDVVGIKDAAVAVLSIDNATREVLSRGWSFNTDRELPLTPDGNGFILTPSNALWVDPSFDADNYVQRWNPNAGTGALTLYNIRDRTFVFSDAVKCDVIYGYEFEQIPQVARNYIATRAARLFQSQVLGSDILFRYTELHESEALANLTRLEARTKDRNIFRSPADTNAIIHRRTNPRRF